MKKKINKKWWFSSFAWIMALLFSQITKMKKFNNNNKKNILISEDLYL